ncbi:hypothetical protein JFL43_16315 [Viridibacillus sp. YIM B01967]|uniref:Lipoprotein n=1 Tax=Viridibacillus soli TaxID=2798301 RepID=A0ABS1HAU9_9BACL|nr:hypothetical protein [Viridibacillus soli]MBK3496394.1 hypothetical protein [Viridibacillus soli]
MNKKNIIFTIVFALILFSAGYFTSKMTSETITREVKIGVESSKNDGQIDYKQIITDAQNQGVIDNFMMIYLNSKPIDHVDINKNHPDLFIEMNSPKQSTGLIDSKVWFTNNGAIIGKRSGESWEDIEYKSINQADADFIREQTE